MDSNLQKLKTTISVCETQPLMVKGLHALLDATDDLQFSSAHATPTEWMLSPGAEQTKVLVIDKALGTKMVMETLEQLATSSTAVAIWGLSITEAEALRFLQAGARGIIRKSAETTAILACLRALAEGRTWMQDSVFRDSLTGAHPNVTLTPRERQVMELVEQGFKNREVAQELGIRPGTVKIHLKHIFEKTGVRGRHGLALNGLRQKGMFTRLAS